MARLGVPVDGRVKKLRARWETARPPLQLLRKKKGSMDLRCVIDQDTLEKVQCPRSSVFQRIN